VTGRDASSPAKPSEESNRPPLHRSANEAGTALALRTILHNHYALPPPAVKEKGVPPTARVQVRIVGGIGRGERYRVQESPLYARVGKGLKPLVYQMRQAATPTILTCTPTDLAGAAPVPLTPPSRGVEWVLSP